MPEVRPWARVLGDVNVSVRRGAWYEVSRLTPDAAILYVNHRSLSVPRTVVEIAVIRPERWSVVERPYDAVDLPMSWGSRYAVCPACHQRAAIEEHLAEMACPRCGGVYQLKLP